MKRVFFLLAAFAALVALGFALGGCAPAAEAPPAAPAAPAAPPEPPFYEGKTIRVIVGLAPGGGYDLYARLVAKHIGKYIPGNPTLVVENMAGAGSLIAANHLYKVAKPDGLTVGVFLTDLLLQQVIGDPAVEFDARKFQWIGAPSDENFALMIRADRGIKTAAELLASPKEIVLGGVPGSNVENYARFLKQYMGAPLRVVSGYAGTAPIRLAIDRGEVDGYINSWTSLRTTHTEAVQTGFVIPLMQVSPSKDAPTVPLIIDLLRTEEAKQMFRLLNAADRATRFWVLPPETPAARVKVLREAFVTSLKDPELLADAAKAKQEIKIVSGEELEKMVKEMFAIPPEVVKKLAEMLK